MAESVEFRLFSNLPWEVQMQVWEHTCSGRLLHLKFMQVREVLTLQPRTGVEFIPTIAHVCKDSRDVFQKHYSILVLNPDTDQIESRVFVDFDIDVVYFGCRFQRTGGFEGHWTGRKRHVPFLNWDSKRGTNVNKIRFAAFDCRFYQALTESTTVPRGLIKQFINLRELNFVPITETSRWRPYLEGRIDSFGFEFLPVDTMSREELFNMKLTKYLEYFKWNLTEKRMYDPPGKWVEEDQADPLYRGSQSSRSYNGDYWPGAGYISDPELKSKEPLFANTTMRIVRDWNIFFPDGMSLARETLFYKKERVARIRDDNLGTYSREELENAKKELKELCKGNPDREEDLPWLDPPSLRMMKTVSSKEETTQMFGRTEEPIRAINYDSSESQE
jgi:hypothetical protein